MFGHSTTRDEKSGKEFRDSGKGIKEELKGYINLRYIFVGNGGVLMIDCKTGYIVGWFGWR